MSLRVLLACALALGVAHGEAHSRQPGSDGDDAEADPVIQTPSGIIHGSWMQTRRGRRFQAYRGIRYAEPPTGELRFQPPQPILHFAGELDARAEGPACPQPVVDPEFIVDEDCLRLNVYTPLRRACAHDDQRLVRSWRPLPVIVFIHPGGFYSFSGRSDIAGPQYLLERDVVFVAINYRIGSLGFLSTGDRFAPGNNGFKDQVAALKWVQRNIAAFGGDPGLVTIAGCSAGSISVALHMISPMSKGLFHHAISMSASPVSQVVIGSEQRDLAVRQARLVNCSTDSMEAIVDCLKTKDWRELANSLDGMFEFNYDPVLLWNVVLEPDFGQERFLTMQPLDAIRQGKMHAVPYIISQTRDEFFGKAFQIQNNATLLNALNSDWDHYGPIAFMLPRGDPPRAVAAARRLREYKYYLDGRQLARDNFTADRLGKLYADAVIGFAVHRMANLMCRHSPHPVYYYEFDYIGNNSFYEAPDTGKPAGVAHQDDMIYLLGLTTLFPLIPLDSPDSRIVDKMTALWYNFARYGEPGPRGDTPELGALAWPVMTPTRREYLRIGDEFSVHEKLFEQRFCVWDELYPIDY